MLKNKKAKIIFYIVCAIIIVCCTTITLILNKQTEKLKEESEIYNTFDVQLKDGTKIETEYFNFENAFYLKIPKDFKPMDFELVKKKYPNGNAPKYVYTNMKTNVNIAASVTDTKMKDSQIKDYVKSMKDTFKDFDDLKTKTYTKEKRVFGEMEFVSPAEDTDIYNHMLFFTTNEKLTIVTFNCTKELQENYKKLGDFVIKSIMFK